MDSWVGSMAASFVVVGCCPVLVPTVVGLDSSLVASDRRSDEQDICSVAVVDSDSGCSDTTFVHLSLGYRPGLEPELLGNDHRGDFQSMDF